MLPYTATDLINAMQGAIANDNRRTRRQRPDDVGADHTDDPTLPSGGHPVPMARLVRVAWDRLSRVPRVGASAPVGGVACREAS